MARYEDPDWPTSATVEGQELRFASGLSSAGRKGKVIAWVWLLGLLAMGVFAAVMVLAS